MEPGWFVLVAREDVAEAQRRIEGVWFGPVTDAGRLGKLVRLFEQEYAAEGVAVTVHLQPRAFATVYAVDEEFFSETPLRDVIEAISAEPMARLQRHGGGPEVGGDDEAGLAWFREAMAYSSEESFTREDMTAVVKAMNYRKGFYGWVLSRFFEVAASGFQFETTTGVSVTVKDEPTDRWNTWGVPSSWEYGFTSLLDADDWIPVQRTMHDDSGRVIEGATVKFPLDVLFGERQQAERDARYAQYLSLKAEFEPSV